MRQDQHLETKLRGHSDTDWQTDAACRASDVSLFYPEPGASVRAGTAKEVCVGCPVATECLHFAFDHHDRYGIWGGQGVKARQRSLRDDIAAGTYIKKLRPIRHGEPSGANEHHKRGELPCWECRQTANEYKVRRSEDVAA